MASIEIVLNARDYQQSVIDYFRSGGKRAFEVWHRRAGKDRVATFIESDLCFERVGLYWHALPEYAHARRVIWDAITGDGQRLIDVNFPPEIVRKRNDQEMKLELINGSIWQLVGADNFDSLVGANPVHVTLSEYALMSPKAWEFLRPILAENNGSALFITTPRGFNHAYDLWQMAKASKLWHTSLLTVDDTKIIKQEILDEEKRTMPDEMFRQEYYCDWAASNVGSILGRYVEEADKEGRINDELEYDPDGAPIEISSDIGRRHISAWWFWQPRVDGYALVDYDQDAGLDAEEWAERIKERMAGRKLKRVWLPHDARAKTFSAKNSAVETFIKAFGADNVRISPLTKKEHSINAARLALRRCHFHRTRCADGLSAMRAWSYRYDDERKQFSKEPVDDWSTDASDAFCEGAKIMQERVIELAPEKKPIIGMEALTLDRLWETEKSQSRARI